MSQLATAHAVASVNIAPSVGRDDRIRLPGCHAPGLLWLCLHLPDLAVEVLRHTDRPAGSSPRSRGEESPLSVVQDEKGRPLIYRSSVTAAASGIVPGMTLTSALALYPTLEIRNRDIGLEHSRLLKLANLANRFTPIVSREPPDSLLLEVSGSLRLFGGIHPLRIRIRDDLSRLGHRSCIAVTPAPAASLLLATNERDTVVHRLEALRSALGPLPVTALPLPQDTLTRLGHAGVRTLRDLWRLPRDGLALRFGPELTSYMSRLMGLTPEPRRSSTPPEKLLSTRELPTGTVETGRLLPVMEALLDELGNWLRIRDAGTRSVRFFLHHQHRPATTVAVGTRLVTRDASRFLRLLAERLKPIRLSEPVTSVTLAAGTPQAWVPEHRSLFPARQNFPDPENRENEWAEVVDQLATRLGAEALRRPASPRDHRPEVKNTMEDRVMTENHPERPIWVLPRALPLKCRHGKPWLDGRLSFAGKPERIETGWWDGGDICRDYHVATNPHGSRLWIYRDADTPGRWLLQGYFA
ncbi:MAG: hypothetical protein LJE91_18550 [Gammaproteobacteria bacterium]|nr:hypothetical protein [Gammaproteobacteria bacterium]